MDGQVSSWLLPFSRTHTRSDVFVCVFHFMRILFRGFYFSRLASLLPVCLSAGDVFDLGDVGDWARGSATYC